MLQAKRTQGIFSRLKQHWFSGHTEATGHSWMLSSLSPFQQQVFVYTEFYGYSQTEIADKLQIPPGSM